MMSPEGEEHSHPTAEMIEAVIDAAISAIIDATMEKRAAKIIKIDVRRASSGAGRRWSRLMASLWSTGRATLSRQR
jgi:hypothetical protein